MSNAVILDNLHKVKLKIAPKNAQRNPAPVDGVPGWGSSDASIGFLEPAADGLSCYVRPASAGAVGTITVTCTADADMGPGVTTITETYSVTFTMPAATQLDMSNDPPEDN